MCDFNSPVPTSRHVAHFPQTASHQKRVLGSRLTHRLHTLLIHRHENTTRSQELDVPKVWDAQASLSEGANPFVIDTDEGDTVETVLDRLLLFPHDERLVTLARESAKDLHSVLPGAERRERINLTLLQLQDAVDREGEVRVDLARQEREAGDAGDALTRASVALQISQCDARTQALALLTLHYCTALQYCTDDVQEGEGEDQIQDANDEEKKTKGKEKQAEG